MMPRLRAVLIAGAILAAWFAGSVARGCYHEIKSGFRFWDLNERLEQAALEGNHSEVRRLLHDGANPNYMGNAHSMLGCAWQSGDPKTINALMDAHPDLNTPLVEAAFSGDNKFVRFLLQNGADPNTKEQNEAVISIARRRGYPDAVKILKGAGAHD